MAAERYRIHLGAIVYEGPPSTVMALPKSRPGFRRTVEKMNPSFRWFINTNTVDKYCERELRTYPADVRTI
jgi:hypothetical protein